MLHKLQNYFLISKVLYQLCIPNEIKFRHNVNLTKLSDYKIYDIYDILTQKQVGLLFKHFRSDALEIHNHDLSSSYYRLLKVLKKDYKGYYFLYHDIRDAIIDPMEATFDTFVYSHIKGYNYLQFFKIRKDSKMMAERGEVDDTYFKLDEINAKLLAKNEQKVITPIISND